MKGPIFSFNYKLNYQNFTQGTSMPIMNCLCLVKQIIVSRICSKKSFHSQIRTFSKIWNSRNKDPIMKLGSLGHNSLEYYAYLSSPWPHAIILMKVMGSCPSLEIILLATWNLRSAVFTWPILSWITHKN
jgi:hypothetical protein